MYQCFSSTEPKTATIILNQSSSRRMPHVWSSTCERPDIPWSKSSRKVLVKSDNSLSLSLSSFAAETFLGHVQWIALTSSKWKKPPKTINRKEKIWRKRRSLSYISLSDFCSWVVESDHLILQSHREIHVIWNSNSAALKSPQLFWVSWVFIVLC